MTSANPQDKVKMHIADWIDRLNKLYDTVQKWESSTATKAERNSIPQLRETLMKKFKVPPQHVPCLTLLKGEKRISFIPSSLWVLNAAGRVNITTDKRTYTLVDMKKSGRKDSSWRLVVDDIEHPLRPFRKKMMSNFWRG